MDVNIRDRSSGVSYLTLTSMITRVYNGALYDLIVRLSKSLNSCFIAIVAFANWMER